jgi:hypothetical protein
MGNKGSSCLKSRKKGPLPASTNGERLLLIATSTNVNLDASADNRPDVYVGHYSYASDGFVPIRVQGMSPNNSRPELKVEYWAEIDLPPGVELRALTTSDFRG